MPAAARIVVGLMILAALSAARADWHFDAETGSVYDSNLSRSDRATDEKDDWSWKSEANVGYGFQVARDLRLNLSGNFREQIWSRFDAFDVTAGGGAASLRYRFGLGRLAPWVLIDNRVTYELLRENARSGWDEKFRVKGGMGITDRISVEAAYTFETFAARDSFFDLSGHSGSVQVRFDVTSSLQLALGYGYRDGDVISYAVPPRPDILLLTTKRRPVNSFDRPYTAYRLDASTHIFSASAGYALGKFVSLQVSYQLSETSHSPLQYVNHLVEAKVAVAY